MRRSLIICGSLHDKSFLILFQGECFSPGIARIDIIVAVASRNKAEDFRRKLLRISRNMNSLESSGASLRGFTFKILLHKAPLRDDEHERCLIKSFFQSAQKILSNLIKFNLISLHETCFFAKEKKINRIVCLLSLNLNLFCVAAVVITFFVCWAPFHAQRLLYLYGKNIESFKSLNQWVFAVSGWLYYVSWWVHFPLSYHENAKLKFICAYILRMCREAIVNICVRKWIMEIFPHCFGRQNVCCLFYFVL